MAKFLASLRVKIWLLTALQLCACAVAQPPEQGGGDYKTTIFVTSNGWHTGIVIAKADIPANLLPEIAEFPDAIYFEFGWGDAKFYPAKKTTLATTMQAAFVATPAVMHVVGLWTTPTRYFPEAEVVPLPIRTENFRLLLAFIDASFKRSRAGRTASTAPGLYANSGFYPATGRFHLLNTCNTWTARALRAAGFKIEVADMTRAEDLMHQIRKLSWM